MALRAVGGEQAAVVQVIGLSFGTDQRSQGRESAQQEFVSAHFGSSLPSVDRAGRLGALTASVASNHRVEEDRR